MAKQQNYWFTKQDVENALVILTAVQAKNIKAIYTIIGLPSAIQEKLIGKTSIDAEKILTTQFPKLTKSYAKDEKEIPHIDPKSQKLKLNALCTKLAAKKQELEQVKKCLDLIHAINDPNVSIKQILNMSDVSYRIIDELNLDNKYTTIPTVVNELNNLLSKFDAPSLENDSDYASGDELLSRSTSETQHTVKSLSNITNPQHDILLKLKEAANEFTLKKGLDNTTHTNNHIDEVINTVGEHPDTH
ncbi:hypothetical protein [Candidatus Tisiphia endosymbiont of Metellina segmentata]|uniref:hypothetical protein n=1 Tax=Candidatus Tisiphia endosymbiont of Metellina segmentata TaxID=3066274 RepID=UPI00313EADF6